MPVSSRKQQKNNRGFILIATLTLVVVSGSYFFISSKKKAEAEERARVEQARLEQIAKEELDSKKIELKTFGHSTKGRPIEGYEVGNGPNVILLIASIHGNEMGTADLMNRFVDEIKADPNVISKNKKLVIIPIANPDGYYDRIDKLNANGVNLNINFATSGWRKYGPEGTYAGAEPFSEVESRIVKEVVEKYSPDVMIDFHAKGALVAPELNSSSVALAKWYVEKTGYEYNDEWDYSGTETKWFVETTGKTAITVELTDYLVGDWSINKTALMELVSSNTLPSL